MGWAWRHRRASWIAGERPEPPRIVTAARHARSSPVSLEGAQPRAAGGGDPCVPYMTSDRAARDQRPGAHAGTTGSDRGIGSGDRIAGFPSDRRERRNGPAPECGAVL
ncbi:hypothetical protein GCM10022248_03380 [Nonomuraea soli]